MKVHHILFIAWVIVFVFWIGKQFSAYNRSKERRK